ncbi:MAG TPA: TIGR03435 family protein [Terracidiphilus sp.]|nr:TIGR03435 family protein [Terracidiphilus sp.]
MESNEGKRSLTVVVTLLLLFVAHGPLGPGLLLRAQSSEQTWEQAAGGKQQFDVASVRENKSDGRSYSNFSLDNGNAYFTVSKKDQLSPSGSLFSANNQTLMRYIIFAYKLSGTQELALRFDFFEGLKLHVPEWVRNDRFDIQARAPGQVSKDQMRLMMQSLLAERFKLAVHMETREAPVFTLELARPGELGPYLRRHPASDDCANTAFPKGSANVVPAADSLSALPIPCGVIAHLPSTAPGFTRFGGRDVALAMLATSLPTQTGMATLPRPVIDETGLRGEYDFSLEWTFEDSSEGNSQESGGTFREALKDQLGLKLKPEKKAVEVLVIDHIEPPAPN